MNAVAVFRNQFKEFIRDKFQLLFFIIWALVTVAWPVISDLGFGESDNWDYPRQIAPALGVAVAGGFTIWIFASVVAKHRANGYLSSVKLTSYLLGVSGFYITLSMVMAVFIALVGLLSGLALVNYMLIILLVVICTMLLGAIIGVLSKNKDTALGVSYPLGIVLLGLIKARNGVYALQILDPIRPYIRWLYAERINNMLIEVHTGNFMSDVYVVLGNIAVLAIIFTFAIKRKM